MLTPARLKTIRAATALRQEDMAQLLGVGIATVVRWEQPHGSLPTGLPRQLYEAMDDLESRGVGMSHLPSMLRSSGAVAVVHWLLGQFLRRSNTE